MIKVTVGDNVERNSVIVDEGKSLREVLTENGVNYSHAVVSLDGVSLDEEELDNSFEDFEVTDRCFLIAVTKADNA